jgi:twitching motility two-component system response regulator PilG
MLAEPSVKVALKLLVLGFTPSERQMLDAIVKLSQRRPSPLQLVGAEEAENADIVMIDTADTGLKKWADSQFWLQSKVVIWVDEQEAPGLNVVQRPIQWSSLPIFLARVLEQTQAVKESAVAINNTVLIVDDSLAVRAQLRSLLEPRGLMISEADNAESAIVAAATTAYACIFMDVIMPGIDGYEACRRIKSNSSRGSKANIIMLTSKSSPFHRIKGKMSGCDAYLTKPIDANHLHEVVSRYIPIR